MAVAWSARSVFGSPVLPARAFLPLLALCLLLSACRKDQTAESAPKPETAEYVSDGAGNGSVWVVDSDHGGRLFICGTIHILREDDYPLAPGYEAAYMFSDKLVLELPPGTGTGGVGVDGGGAGGRPTAIVAVFSLLPFSLTEFIKNHYYSPECLCAGK